jgi:hypothetical protein
MLMVYLVTKLMHLLSYVRDIAVTVALRVQNRRATMGCIPCLSLHCNIFLSQERENNLFGKYGDINETVQCLNGCQWWKCGLERSKVTTTTMKSQGETSVRWQKLAVWYKLDLMIHLPSLSLVCLAGTLGVRSGQSQ